MRDDRFGLFGAGSMLVALVLPRVLDRYAERGIMLGGGLLATIALVATSMVTGPAAWWPAVLVTWCILGAASSLVLTPAGQVITAAVAERQRPAAFAAHFSLSHACYLLAYPVAGWVGQQAGLPAASMVLAAVAAAAVIVASMTWPSVEGAQRDR